MAIIKCKMCGGDMELTAETSVAECEYCGSKQTVPKADDEKKLTLFARAGRLLRACEFDKAAGVYETLVAEFPEEAEAYWGLVLCKYGIEYVDDPATGKKIPTCHRSSFESVMDDANLEQATENADLIARRVYRDEAKAIEELRKSIIEVSGKEEPYDIFICYKETAEDGDRTVDSVIAQDVYDALTEKGYRVFFSRITLEDKLGQEYEPYIFAALHSAKIMLAFGTDFEYYNAVWVKNEWSRFLQMMAAGEKKTLIPCYKGIDAYDMPKEFAKLQAQDMGKVGAVQDLLRGIEKILPRETAVPVQQVVVQQAAGGETAPLLKRAFMFLEDGVWDSADEYCEKVLDLNPECAEAYLGKLMAELRVKTQEALKDQANPFDNRNNYQKAIRFASAELKAELEEYLAQIDARQKDAIYAEAEQKMQAAKTEAECWEAMKIFEKLSGWKDANVQIEKCREKAREIRERETAIIQNAAYDKAVRLMDEAKNRSSYLIAAKAFEAISGRKDAAEKAAECRRKADDCLNEYIYNKASNCLNTANCSQDYLEAARLFMKISGWQDADELVRKCQEMACLRAEEERIAAEKRAEEERIAAEKRAEEERIAAKKRAEQERKEAEERARKEAEERQKAQWRQAGVCQHCGGELKGLFFKKCVNCGKPKDY